MQQVKAKFNVMLYQEVKEGLNAEKDGNESIYNSQAVIFYDDNNYKYLGALGLIWII